ncbi:hypothetical protein K4K52_002426 [Colletotrichum sp. SAR 10_76]|nr:hypothetical protein K4K52_002426 [Colletotrichum sp. SAR 10_76]
MSANDYYGGSRRNSHTPGSRSSKTYLSTPLVDQAGYYPELDVPLGERPRSAMANRSKFGNGYHSRSRSTGGGPPGSDAQLGTGKEGERGLLSTIGGGAAGGFAGKKLLGGGKLGTAAGALGGAVIANKIEHRISGSHHHSSSHSSSHHHSHSYGGGPHYGAARRRPLLLITALPTTAPITTAAPHRITAATKAPVASAGCLAI